MKPVAEQDHYEILEASREASPEEIERAYRLALGTYADDSLAGYSIFGEGDAAALRQRIEAAYRVLSQPDARRAYDASLAAVEPEPVGPAAEAPVVSGALPPDELDELDDEQAEFDGSRLRRCRLQREMELEEISAVTKVNPTYLGYIEEERFDRLPAPVYVRGFVVAFASCLGLDGSRVARSYMQRYESLHDPPRRRRGR